MADIITTEYDDDSGNDFIQCEYCDKSIRGDTQYKIHLTTNQHLKKKESMNLKDDMPVWENFLDYLDYLRLDEPIIGLSAVEQLESQVLGNGQFRLKYKCRMCNLEADLPAMASHVVGRKHRQKFLELNRPDLVTWDKFSIHQQGKVIRAKAEVVERQEGRGVPLDLHPKKRNSKWNSPRRDNASPNPRFQNQRQNMGPQQGGLDQDYLRYDPPGMDIPPQNFPEDPRYQEKPVDDGYYSASSYRRGDDYPEDARHQRGYLEEDDHFRPSFPERDEYGQQYPRDNHREEPYREDRRRPLADEPPRQAYGKGDRYEPSFYDDDPQGQLQPGDDRHSGERYPDRDLPRRPYQGSQAQAYQEKEPPHQHTDYNHGMRLYSERDASGYSYPQVDHRQPAVSEDYRQAYPEEDVYDRHDQEDVGRGIYSRPYSKDESLEWHPKVDTDRRFHGHDGKHYSERGFELHNSQDYRSERGHSSFATERNRGSEARYGGEMPESRMNRDQAGARGPRLRVSEIQERLGSHEESASTRKRKSRFSDCTEAERELLQKCQMAQAVSQKLVQNPPMKVKRRPESDRLREDYRGRGGAQQDPGNVLDVLNGVQIESVEEANFLKNKLCSLLKEFQANKSGPRGASPMGSRDFEQPRKEVQERPRSEEYNYQMREMVAAERDHEIRQPLLSVDYGFRSREMAAAECGYDEMQKQPLYDEYSYRMREIQTGGRGHDEIQGRLPSDDYNYPRREIPDVGRGPDNFRQISPEHFNRRSYEQDQRWRRGETSRPAEMFENFPRDDLNRGEYRSSQQEGSLRFHEGSQRSYYDVPFEDDPRDFHPHSAQMSFDEERRNPPSNLDKIASTLLQLVAHK